MRVGLQGFSKSPSNFIGRRTFIHNVKQNLELHNHEIDYSLTLDNDIVFAESVLQYPIIKNYFPDLLKKTIFFIHSLDYVMPWHILKTMDPDVKIVSPYQTITEQILRFSPARVATVPYPVYTINNFEPNTGTSTLFLGRVDSLSKFDILSHLKQYPEKFLRDNDIRVVGACGNRQYAKAVSSIPGLMVHLDCSEYQKHALIQKAKKVFCLSSSPQESYGFMPREVLYTDKPLVTTFFSGYKIDEFPDLDLNHQTIALEESHFSKECFKDENTYLQSKERAAWIHPDILREFILEPMPFGSAYRNEYLETINKDFARRVVKADYTSGKNDLKLFNLYEFWRSLW